MKSVEYMPVLLVFSLFVNGCVWFAFALLVTDIFVVVSVIVVSLSLQMKDSMETGDIPLPYVNAGAKCIRDNTRSHTVLRLFDVQKLATCGERAGGVGRRLF